MLGGGERAHGADVLSLEAERGRSQRRPPLLVGVAAAAPEDGRSAFVEQRRGVFEHDRQAGERADGDDVVGAVASSARACRACALASCARSAKRAMKSALRPADLDQRDLCLWHAPPPARVRGTRRRRRGRRWSRPRAPRGARARRASRPDGRRSPPHARGPSWGRRRPRGRRGGRRVGRPPAGSPKRATRRRWWSCRSGGPGRPHRRGTGARRHGSGAARARCSRRSGRASSAGEPRRAHPPPE